MEQIINVVLIVLIAAFSVVVICGLILRVLKKSETEDAVVGEKHESVFRMAAVSHDGRKHLYVATFHTSAGDRVLSCTLPVYERIREGDACRITYKGTVLKHIEGDFSHGDEITGEL